jgi:hypothetical protein
MVVPTKEAAMRTRDTHSWLAIVVVALLSLFAVAADTGSARQAAATVGSFTFEDSVGEAGAAPDIATVIVSNDDAGLITFTIRLANRGALNPGELVIVEIDSDANPTTGEPPAGFEYAIQYYRSASLWRWDGGAQDYTHARMNSLISQVGNGAVILKVSAAELGRTSTFRFSVYADANPEDPAAVWDVAPDRGKDLFAYTLELYVKPAITLAPLTLRPLVVKAGAKVTTVTQVTVVRGGVSEALPKGTTVSWKATVGGIALKPARTTLGVAGSARAVWNLPATAKGKQLRVTTTAVVESVTVTRNAVIRIG